MHKSKTSAELEGPRQLVGTKEGCPKSRRCACIPCLPWAAAPSLGVLCLLRGEEKAQIPAQGSSWR